MKVCKFGGTSVQNAERISAVIEIIKDKLKQDANCVVVVSALGGVTNQLNQIARNAEAGNFDLATLEALKQRHLNCLQELTINDPHTKNFILNIFDTLEEKLKGVELLKELTKKTLDAIQSSGEILSAKIISEAFKTHNITAHYLQATEVIKTNNNFGNGQVKYEETYENIRKYFNEHLGVNIVTGFIAESESHEIITLGRGGSDFTAALIGAALKTQEIEIWTDVDGLYTANPKIVQKAFPQAYVSFAEAMELSHFGAKVIYPPAVQPALNADIPILIKNSFNPQAKGTIIGNNSAENRTTICGISSINSVSLLRLEGSGMQGISGTSKRLFTALAEKGINIILITQASSEHTICFAVSPQDTEAAVDAVNNEFNLEIKANIIQPVITNTECSIISIVGENMRLSPGTAGKTFSALGKNGININAIAQGSSELNISAVISRHDEVKALKALHEEFFFPDTRAINVCLIGAGLIGNELIDQLRNHIETLEAEHDHMIRVIGIANTSKMLFNPEGIPVSELSKNNLEQGQESDFNKLFELIRNSSLPNMVFVDCTASKDVADKYLDILRKNISIITPNKKAQSADYETYQHLKQAASKRGISFLYETSVGAGLPVISTLNDLLKSGDQILKIEAVLSGTLSFIFNSFTEGKSFADIVIQAREAGFTEPDPRDDLNGLDVARKILILARECGCDIELNDVQVENLVPKNCRNTQSIQEFLKLLKDSDEYFNSKLQAALQKQGKLCYIAKFENNKATVELAVVDNSHPFYNLSGSDNIVSFTTNRYKNRPLVIKGPGAGAAVTAAGVFADIIRLASY